MLKKLFADALSRHVRGDAGGALLAYRRIQRRFPDFPDAWANASALLCEMGRFEEARRAAERAIELYGPDSPDSPNGLGVMDGHGGPGGLNGLGGMDGMGGSGGMGRSDGLDGPGGMDAPGGTGGGGPAAALFSLAIAQDGLGRPEDAEKSLREAIQRNPAHAPALHRLADILIRMGRLGDARRAAERALEADPETPGAHYTLGLACQKDGCTDEAVAHYRMAIGRDPGHAAAVVRLASIYAGHGHTMEAVGLCDAAERHCHDPAARSMLMAYRGEAKVPLMDFAGAELDLQEAVELEQGSRARSVLAYLLSLQGRYREAWDCIRRGPEWRAGRTGSDGPDVPNVPDVPNGPAESGFGAPRWRGGPVRTDGGGALLLYASNHSSGGYGDVIQFSRFFPRVREMCGGRLFLYTYESLRRLMGGLVGVGGLDGIFAGGDALPRFDAAAPMGELPALADADLSDIPPPAKLLHGPPPAPPPEMDRLGLRVGLVWAGSASTLHGTTRDIDPACFGALADALGAARTSQIAWYGLTKDPSCLPRLPGFVDLSPRMGDFMDTARMVARMDLVATVDTSMAHLAGSLGVPTLALLAHLPDWRWGLGKATPWYPAARLLRQPSHGDWGAVVGMLAAEIAGALRGAGV
jgi:tetratricopeptide (TPR) repeat protein